ncbi:class I SAM-dependent methyltransferase [Microbacteriaceae bacterium 4G12]
MKRYSYIDLIALLGVGSAHPGGFMLTKQTLQSVYISPSTRVLDVGCGTGRTAVYIAKLYGCPVTALDNHRFMLEKAQKHIQREGVPVRLVEGNVEQLPFHSDSFDIALSESVLIFTDSTKALQELYRVLSHTGKAIIIEMTVERLLHPKEKEEIQGVYGVQDILTERQWVEKLYQAGFSRVHKLGGGTVASTIPTYTEQPDWDFSPQMDSVAYTVWTNHETIIRKYCHLLGHRTFLCEK